MIIAPLYLLSLIGCCDPFPVALLISISEIQNLISHHWLPWQGSSIYKSNITKKNNEKKPLKTWNYWYLLFILLLIFYNQHFYLIILCFCFFSSYSSSWHTLNAVKIGKVVRGKKLYQHIFCKKHKNLYYCPCCHMDQR